MGWVQNDMSNHSTTTGLPESKLTPNQTRTFRADYTNEHGEPETIIATARHDDQCGNGHNSFSITGEIYTQQQARGEPTVKHKGGRTLWLNSCGCVHTEIARHFPRLASLIKWHLTSTDGPMHYVANALYWAGHKGYRDGGKSSPPNLEHLKSTIVYGVLAADAEFDLADHLYRDGRAGPGFTRNEAKAHELEEWLIGRLEPLTLAFMWAVESLGFDY